MQCDDIVKGNRGLTLSTSLQLVFHCGVSAMTFSLLRMACGIRTPEEAQFLGMLGYNPSWVGVQFVVPGSEQRLVPAGMGR